MNNRALIWKLILGGVGTVAVLLVCTSLFTSSSVGELPNSGALRQSPADTNVNNKSHKMTPFNAEFWKHVDMEANAIPSSVVQEAKQITVHEKTIFIQNSNIFCQISVPPANVPVTNQFVLLLHGAAFNSQTWRKLGTIQLLAAMGHTTVAIDLPGFGKSTGSRGGIDFLPDVLKTLETDDIFSGKPLLRPVLVSPSMSGGYSVPLLRQQVSVPASDTFMSGYVPVAPVKTNLLTSKDAKAVQVPTLIIRGENDTGLGLSSVKDLKEIPSSQVKVLPDAGHPAYLDQPELFHKLLFNFLNYVREKNN